MTYFLHARIVRTQNIDFLLIFCERTQQQHVTDQSFWAAFIHNLSVGERSNILQLGSCCVGQYISNRAKQFSDICILLYKAAHHKMILSHFFPIQYQKLSGVASIQSLYIYTHAIQIQKHKP